MSNIIMDTRCYLLKGHQQQVLSVHFSPDGRTIASASADKTVKLWNITGQLQNTLSGHTKGVWSVRFSPPDGKMLASSSFDTTVRLWSVKGEFLRTLTGHKDVVYDVSFSPDSKLIATSSKDGTIKLWDTTTGELSRTLEDTTAQDRIYSVDFSKDGLNLASAGYKNGSVKLWNLENFTPAIIDSHQQSVNFVRFSPDGKILASSSDDGSINLWKDGQLLHSIKAHKKFIYGLAFSRDSETIASASTDGTIKVWKLDGTLVETLKGHSGEVYAVSFSPNEYDYQLIASAGEDTTVRLWKTDGEEEFCGYSESGNYLEAFTQALKKMHRELSINVEVDDIDFRVSSRTTSEASINPNSLRVAITLEKALPKIATDKTCEECDPKECKTNPNCR